MVGTYSWLIYSTNPTTFGLTTDQVEGVGLFFLWSEMTYIKVISLDVTHTVLYSFVGWWEGEWNGNILKEDKLYREKGIKIKYSKST